MDVCIWIRIEKNLTLTILSVEDRELSIPDGFLIKFVENYVELTCPDILGPAYRRRPGHPRQVSRQEYYRMLRKLNHMYEAAQRLYHRKFWEKMLERNRLPNAVVQLFKQIYGIHEDPSTLKFWMEMQNEGKQVLPAVVGKPMHEFMDMVMRLDENAVLRKSQLHLLQPFSNAWFLLTTNDPIDTVVAIEIFRMFVHI
jgi:hypothetical protein